MRRALPPEGLGDLEARLREPGILLCRLEKLRSGGSVATVPQTDTGGLG